MTIARTIKRALKPLVPSPIRRSLRAMFKPLPPDFVPPDDGFPHWERWIWEGRKLWNPARRKASRGSRVLLATSSSGFAPMTMVESVLGAALTLRGADVRFLVCDRALPACQLAQDLHHDPEPLARYALPTVLCPSCYGRGSRMHEGLGLKVLSYSEFLSDRERADARWLAGAIVADKIPECRLNGISVGEHSLAGALRFYARGELKDAPEGETTLRRYFEAALLTSSAVRNLLARERIDRACFHHGIYVPQGIIAEECRAAGVPMATWNVAYRKSCFIFSHDDTYHHTMLTEPVESWENMTWGPEQEREVMEYLASRLTGTKDWIWFHEKPVEDIEQIGRELGVDFKKPVVGLLTNVFWDAQLHYRANAFKDMLEWIVETIRWFAKRPDLQLLIRIHPAEVRGTVPSRQPLFAEIRKAFPDLPSNVFVIPPESNSSTYAAMYHCDSVLIYGTKTGVELTSVGIPVIVAGEAWVRGKGLTRDASSPEEYFRILAELPFRKRLDEATTRRARKYAYHFFFRRMIPMPFLEPVKARPVPFEVRIAGLSDLLPGKHPGLDVICDGILNGTPFIHRAERFTMQEAA